MQHSSKIFIEKINSYEVIVCIDMIIFDVYMKIIYYKILKNEKKKSLKNSDCDDDDVMTRGADKG